VYGCIDSNGSSIACVYHFQLLSTLEINGIHLPIRDIVEALNYGDYPFSQFKWSWGFQSEVTRYYPLWDQGFVLDLSDCMLGRRRHEISFPSFSYAACSHGFEQRRRVEDDNVVLKAITGISLLECSLKIRFPRSYAVASLIFFVRFLRERITPGRVDKDHGVHDFIDQMTEWWRNTFETHFRCTTSPSNHV